MFVLVALAPTPWITAPLIACASAATVVPDSVTLVPLITIACPFPSVGFETVP